MLPTLLLSALMLAPNAASAGQPLDAARTAQIDRVVEAVLRRLDAGSATIAIVDHGHIVYRHAYGLRDREARLPADLATHYEIGSITKQFTAAAILQLRAAGKLQLDDKLSRYLPQAPHAGEVTLRQLLSHTSGLPDYLDGPDIDQEATHPASFEQLLARIADKPLQFIPGTDWSYDNTGYLLLGKIIEQCSGQSYRDYLQTHFFDPLGMHQSFTVAEEAQLPDMAIGYLHEQQRWKRAGTLHDDFGRAAGNIVSTVDDLQRWSAALAAGNVVSAQDYALMATSLRIPRGSADYGLGLFVDQLDGQPRIGHTGGSLGFTSADFYFPQQGLRLIALTNDRQNPEPGEMITTALFELLRPQVAAGAWRAAPGEDARITGKTRRLFTQLQQGAAQAAYTDLLGPTLAAKMDDQHRARLRDAYAPWGKPRRLVFKGTREMGEQRWYDYLIQFGPGSQLKFGVRLDAQGRIVGISFG